MWQWEIFLKNNKCCFQNVKPSKISLNKNGVNFYGENFGNIVEIGLNATSVCKYNAMVYI